MDISNEINKQIYEYRKNNIYGDSPEYLVLTKNKLDVLSLECRIRYDDATKPNHGFIATYNGIPVINGDNCLIL